MWYIIAIMLILIIGAFLLGIYLIFRKIGNKVSEIPSHVVKETFSIIKEKVLSTKNETNELKK